MEHRGRFKEGTSRRALQGGKYDIDMGYLRFLQQLLNFRVDNTLDLFVIRIIFFDAGALDMLEPLFADAIVPFVPSDIVDLHRVLIEFTTVVACCSNFEGRMTTQCGVKIVIQCRVDIVGMVCGWY